MYSARSFYSVVGVVFGLVMAAPYASTASADTPNRPNILFILADDWGWGDLGCHGNKLVHTPNLDRLAKEGTEFYQFNVGSPVCSPSRVAFMTGQFPARFGVHEASNSGSIPPSWRMATNASGECSPRSGISVWSRIRW